MRSGRLRTACRSIPIVWRAAAFGDSPALRVQSRWCWESGGAAVAGQANGGARALVHIFARRRRGSPVDLRHGLRYLVWFHLIRKAVFEAIYST